MKQRAHWRPLAVVAAAAGAAVVVTPALASPAAADTDGPTNIIVLISDGAGYNQFDAASLYEHGTSYHQVAVDPATGFIEHTEGTASQVYESYPVQLGLSHYSANGRADYVTEDAWGDFAWVGTGATDSAAAATAFGTGVKTTNGTIGYDADGQRLVTAVEQASAVGLATGLVTDVPFNHATPAGFVAHNQDRNDYHGLATEMIDSDLNVIMGGGHPNFTDAHTSRSSNYTWISQDDFERVSSGETPYRFVESRGDFEALAAGADVPERVFGLAQVAETLQYNRPGLENDDVLPGTDPSNDVASLPTMALGALNVLSQDEDGFFLMVEAGAVDWAGHANQTTRVVEEQLTFNRTVEAVHEWVETNSSWEETLVVVTADHETGYLAGPDANPTWTPLTGAAGELPAVSWHSGGHTNALVPFYAIGAGSELLQARATQWDAVRGAYLDNTDLGKVLFDVLGHAYSDEESAVPLEAEVPLVLPSGTLSLSVAPVESPVGFEAGTEALVAQLPEVTVADTRNEVEAQGNGWTVSGSAADFVAGNRTIDAANLSWVPQIVDSEGGAEAGPTAALDAPAALADADRTSRLGTTVVGADLQLSIPAGAEAGSYGSEITLTLFAKD